MLKNGENMQQDCCLHECVSGWAPEIAPEHASCCTFSAILKNFSARLGHIRVSSGSEIVKLQSEWTTQDSLPAAQGRDAISLPEWVQDAAPESIPGGALECSRNECPPADLNTPPEWIPKE